MMETYHSTYCIVYAKCKQASTDGRHFMEIRPGKTGGYRLLAHRALPRGWVERYWPDSGFVEWAVRITNRLVALGLCQPAS